MGKFDLLDLINNGIFCLYNIYSELMLRTIDRKYIKIIKQNSRIVNDQNNYCFIIGNGPSINNIDLKLIEEQDTFTVNYFYNSNKYKDFNSKYHVLVDEAFYEGDGLKYFLSLYKEKPEVIFFLRHHAYRKIKDTIRNNNAYYMYQKKMQVGKKINIDITRNCDACINVIISAIEIAIFLNYKNIYLIGCDFNSYCSNIENHFYNKDESIKKIRIGDELKYYALAHKHLYALEDFSKYRGISIINLTENSLIDAFEKRKLDSVLKEIKENI